MYSISNGFFKISVSFVFNFNLVTISNSNKAIIEIKVVDDNIESDDDIRVVY